MKLPNLPKRPKLTSGQTIAVVVIVSLFLLYSLGSQLAQFPLNGNPIVWAQAQECYKEGARFRQRFDLVNAERKFKEAASLYPKDSRFQEALGECQMRLKKLPEAEAALKSAVELNPRDTSAWRLLSKVYAMQNRAEDSLKSIHKALDVSPSDAVATAQLGLLLASTGKMEEAAKIFDQSRSLAREEAEYWTLAGQYYKLLGKPQETEAAFRQAISKDPLEPENAEWLGLCLISVNKPDEGETYLQKAVQINPYDSGYWTTLAHAQADAGHVDGSLSSLKKAIELDPNNWNLQKNYALILLQAHRYPESEKAFAQAIAGGGDDQAAISYYMESLVLQKKFDQAEKFIKEKLQDKRNSEAPQLWVLLGDTLGFAGKKTEASDAYKQALACPNVSPLFRSRMEEKMKTEPVAIDTILKSIKMGAEGEAPAGETPTSVEDNHKDGQSSSH